MRTQTHQNSNCQQQIELLWYTWGHQVPAHPFELQASKKKHAFSQAFELNFAAMLKWILYIYIHIYIYSFPLLAAGASRSSMICSGFPIRRRRPKRSTKTKPGMYLKHLKLFKSLDPKSPSKTSENIYSCDLIFIQFGQGMLSQEFSR